jgi:hypothetical protein
VTRASLATAERLERYPLAERFPDLSYHYGLSFREIINMPRWALELYLEAMTRLIAEDSLHAVEVVSFPHMGERDRRRVERALKRLAGSPTSAPVAKDKYDSTLAGVGIKVVR